VANFTTPTASREGGEDWVGIPIAGLDFIKQKNTLPLLQIEKYIAPAPNRTPDRLARSLIPVLITLSM